MPPQSMEGQLFPNLSLQASRWKGLKGGSIAGRPGVCSLQELKQWNLKLNLKWNTDLYLPIKVQTVSDTVSVREELFLLPAVASWVSSKPRRVYPGFTTDVKLDRQLKMICLVLEEYGRSKNHMDTGRCLERIRGISDLHFHIGWISLLICTFSAAISMRSNLQLCKLSRGKS